MIRRSDCLKELALHADDDLFVVGITGINWEWRRIRDHDGNMLIGSLGHAGAVALGMALTLPRRRVIALETDGSTLFDLPSLTAMATYQPSNLKVFVFDNEVYSGSRISQPSATASRTDIEAMARGAGIERTATVSDLEAFRERAGLAFEEAGLQYVVAKIEEDVDVRRLPKPRMDYLENMYRFIRYVERTEDRPILPELR